MNRFALIGVCAVLINPSAALAQSPPSSPFASAAQYRADRGATPSATQRLRYEITIADAGRPVRTSTLVIDVASDWALVTNGNDQTLMDYRLNRDFSLKDGQFESGSGTSLLMFRVLERQNRNYLAKVVGGLAGSTPVADDCDADAELGVSLGPPAGQPRLVERGGSTILDCLGRVRGSFTAGNGAKAPAAFWPTMNNLMLSHPSLFRAIRATGTAPAVLETVFRPTAGPENCHTWRLISVEVIDAPYPLMGSQRNTTATWLDQKLGDGLGSLAADAVAGRAKGGAPTAESWTRDLRATFDKGGSAPLAMAMLPTFNMFPQSLARCSSGGQEQICQALSTARGAIANEAGPKALFAVAQAEGKGDSAAAIAAMQAAQATPYRNDPALGAAYALAMRKFDKAAAEKAVAAGLPSDAKPLQTAAVTAYPYNPAYWLDIADRYVVDYDLQTATLLYDVALSLPMPEAVADNVAVKSKRDVLSRIRRDFPDASLAP